MQKLTNFFMGIDPGWVRLEQSAKGALAYISAALITLLIITVVKPTGAGSAVFYALMIAFIGYLSVNDSEPRARQRTLLLSAIPFALAPFVVGIIGNYLLIHAIVLVTLIFISYYLRRYGLRMAEVGTITVFAYYFSLMFGATWAIALWFALGGIIGILSAYFWQFYVRPYDPERYLFRSVIGLDQNIIAVVKIIQGELTLPSEGPTEARSATKGVEANRENRFTEDATPDVTEGEANQDGAADEQLIKDEAREGDDEIEEAIKDDNRGADKKDPIARVFLRVQKARQVIEQYLTAVAGFNNFPQVRLTQLRLQLFNIEQGVERLTAGSRKLFMHKGALPDSLQDSLYQILSELQLRLQPADGDSAPPAATAMEALAKIEEVQKRIALEIQEIEDRRLTNELRLALLQFGIGTAQIARSLARVRAIVADAEQAKRSAAATPAPEASKPAAPKLPAPSPDANFFQRLHPTTKLGIQASLAVALAMLVSYLLKLDHPNWAFWTAFVVIAGSTGESVRKILYRVGGTIVGAIVGTLLLFILPDNNALILALGLFCLFLALYTRIINYAWMVFWIVVFISFLYSLKGEAPAVVLVTRPVNTIIGALIAVAVVWFVFPLHAGERFHQGLLQYFKALDLYISTLSAAWLGEAPVAAVDGAKVQMEEIYDKVSQAFPAVAMEYNPLTQASSPLSSQATIVEAIHADVTHLTQSVTSDVGMIAAVNPTVVQHLQGSFHNHVQQLEAHLAPPQGAVAPAPPPAALAGAIPSLVAATPSAEWQQAVAYFSSLDRAVIMLSNQIEEARPGGIGRRA